MRGHLRTLIIVLVTGGLLALFLRQANLAEVWGEIRAARIGLLALGLVATLIVYVFRAARWQALLEPIGPARFAPAFRATVIGFAANALLPARAGELIRPYLLARREGMSATATFATVILERILDLLTVLFLFGVFVFFFDSGLRTTDPATYRAVKAGGVVAAATAVALLALMFLLAGHPERIGRAVQRAEHVLPARFAHLFARLARTFAEGLAVMRQARPLLRALYLSVPVWLSIAAGIWLVARAFHITMPFTGSFLIVALLTIGVAVPTPGAVGGFHYAFRVGATAFFGAPNERAVGAAIVLHAISFVPIAVLGLIFMVQDGLSLTRVRSLAGKGEAGAIDEAGVAPGAGDASEGGPAR
jgi:uncharacterized protein (TIRG00374 family)